MDHLVKEIEKLKEENIKTKEQLRIYRKIIDDITLTIADEEKLWNIIFEAEEE